MYDRILTPQQTAIRDHARRLTQEHILPRAEEIDRSGEYPWDLVELCAREGLFAQVVPQEYGGSGADYLSRVLVVEEVARGCASVCAILQTAALCAYPIILAGTEEQKRRFLPPLAQGCGGAFALTEPEAGSDAGALTTTAVREGEHYVLNGKKWLIGNGGPAQLYIVLCSTNASLGSKGISAFIVEKGTPGFDFGTPADKMGLRGTITGELLFNDCRVLSSHLLGERDKGFRLALQTLDWTRLTVAAQAIGIAQAAFDEAVGFVKTRVQFDRPIADNQGVQFMLADMNTSIHAARLMTYHAACLLDLGVGRIRADISMAKLFATEMATRVVHHALQLHGGRGYLKGYAVERHYRDVRVAEIYEGTSEIMRLLIAREALRDR